MTDQPTPPPSQQPNYGAAPSFGSSAATGGTPDAPVKAPPGTDFPGKTLGIVSLIAGIVSYFILPFVAGLAALIMGAIARSQSKKAGFKNTPATVGLILGIINVILSIIGLILIIVAGAALFGNIAAQCADLGPGTHYVDGVTYTCS